MAVAVPRAYDAAVVVIPAEEFIDGDMSFSARAYWHVGGFRIVPTGEKADVVERFEAAGHPINRDIDLSVITSKRIQARDPYGSAGDLTQLGRTAAGDCA